MDGLLSDLGFRPPLAHIYVHWRRGRLQPFHLFLLKLPVLKKSLRLLLALEVRIVAPPALGFLTVAESLSGNLCLCPVSERSECPATKSTDGLSAVVRTISMCFQSFRLSRRRGQRCWSSSLSSSFASKSCDRHKTMTCPSWELAARSF